MGPGSESKSKLMVGRLRDESEHHRDGKAQPLARHRVGKENAKGDVREGNVHDNTEAEMTTLKLSSG